MSTPKPFSSIPKGSTLKLHPFTSHHPQADIDRLKRKLNDTEDIPSTYENSFADEEMELGVRKGWIEEMLGVWRNEYDWRKTEEEINTFPNYTVPLSANGHNHTIHFMALFSEKEDAIPVIMTHGWPGSFLEFIPLFQSLSSKYTPATLPIHLICPSMPGFGFSSPPPRHSRHSNEDTATLWDGLMKGLGFQEYVAQGGDIGSFVSQVLAQKFEGCKAAHVNMFRCPKPEIDKSTLDTFDRDCVERLEEFLKTEFAYRDEHATKPSTIGMVVASSPVALLAWIGEKFIRWSDTTPSAHHILGNITLYYLTRTFPTSLYHYWAAPPSRYALPETQPNLKALKQGGKPIGYSLFKKEITPFLPEWGVGHVNMVWSKKHEQGGHFAALEQPELLWEDLQDFLKIAWKPKSHL